MNKKVKYKGFELSSDLLIKNLEHNVSSWIDSKSWKGDDKTLFINAYEAYIDWLKSNDLDISGTGKHSGVGIPENEYNKYVANYINRIADDLYNELSKQDFTENFLKLYHFVQGDVDLQPYLNLDTLDETTNKRSTKGRGKFVKAFIDKQYNISPELRAFGDYIGEYGYDDKAKLLRDLAGLRGDFWDLFFTSEGSTDEKEEKEEENKKEEKEEKEEKIESDFWNNYEDILDSDSFIDLYSLTSMFTKYIFRNNADKEIKNLIKTLFNEYPITKTYKYNDFIEELDHKYYTEDFYKDPAHTMDIPTMAYLLANAIIAGRETTYNNKRVYKILPEYKENELQKTIIYEPETGIALLLNLEDLITSHKNGGLIFKFQEGGSIYSDIDDFFKQKNYKDGSDFELKTRDLGNTFAKIWENTNFADKAALNAVLADLTSMGLSFIPGRIGKLGSLSAGLSGTTSQFVSDVARDGLDWGDVGNAALNVAFDVGSVLPFMGKVARSSKITKNISKLIPAALSIWQGFNATNITPEMADVINRFHSGESITEEDYYTVLNAIRSYAGALGSAAMATKANFGKDVYTITLKNNTSDELKYLHIKDPKHYAIIQKGGEEAEKLLKNYAIPKGYSIVYKDVPTDFWEKTKKFANVEYKSEQVPSTYEHVRLMVNNPKILPLKNDFVDASGNVYRYSEGTWYNIKHFGLNKKLKDGFKADGDFILTNDGKVFKITDKDLETTELVSDYGSSNKATPKKDILKKEVVANYTDKPKIDFSKGYLMKSGNTGKIYYISNKKDYDFITTPLLNEPTIAETRHSVLKKYDLPVDDSYARINDLKEINLDNVIKLKTPRKGPVIAPTKKRLGGYLQKGGGVTNTSSTANWFEHIYKSESFKAYINKILNEKDSIKRQQLINEFNNLQKEYSKFSNHDSSKLTYSDDVKTWLTNFHKTGINTAIQNLISQNLIQTKGTTGDNASGNWADGYFGNMSYLRHLGSEASWKDQDVKKFQEELKKNGLDYYLDPESKMYLLKPIEVKEVVGSEDKEEVIPDDYKGEEIELPKRTWKDKLKEDTILKFSLPRALYTDYINRKLLKIAKRKEEPYIPSSITIDRYVLGNPRAINEGELLMSDLLLKASNIPYASAELRVAAMLDAYDQGSKYKLKGLEIHDQTAEKSHLLAWNLIKENLMNLHKASEEGKLNIMKTNANKASYDMAYLAKKHEIWDTYSKELQNKFETNLERLKALQEIYNKQAIEINTRNNLKKYAPHLSDEALSVWNDVLVGSKTLDGLSISEKALYKSAKQAYDAAVWKNLGEYLSIDVPKLSTKPENYFKSKLIYKKGGSIKERIANADRFYKSIRDDLNRNQKKLDLLFKSLYKLTK